MPLAFLCLRRGVSHFILYSHVLNPFSLPTQRCFHSCETMPFDRLLFSAYAEVFPLISTSFPRVMTFLCLRRGVSHHLAPVFGMKFFSLPTQRCFCTFGHRCQSSPLFSAYAEVFPPERKSLPEMPAFLCLRRGVSSNIFQSLHKGELFSAYAEVFLLSGALHPCHLPFSLPTQRCFPPRISLTGGRKLFSAYAEVFPGL